MPSLIVPSLMIISDSDAVANTVYAIGKTNISDGENTISNSRR